MNLHCTQKLYTKLPEQKNANPTVMPAIGLQPKWLNWHSNLITIQRRQCVILVHDATRFALLIPCLTKKDFADLNWHFEDVFINTLLKSEVSSDLINVATENLRPLQFDTFCDRSVQGTMNQMTQEINFSMSHRNIAITDINAYRFSAWLSDRPCNIKGQKDCLWPPKSMSALLSEIKNSNNKTLLH